MTNNPLKIKFIDYYQAGRHREIVDWLYEHQIKFEIDWIKMENVYPNNEPDCYYVNFPTPYLLFTNPKDAMFFKLRWQG